MNTVQKPMYEWNNLPWREIEKQVFKLQKQIYQASLHGDQAKVHKLQRLLMNSWSARCLAVRRVSQDNRGKKAAGIDGIKELTPSQRLKLVEKLSQDQKAKPLRRVWIPKPGTQEKRGLSIPTMDDRAAQALAKLALEPEWEAKFEPNTYGFRPGRSTHDAIEAIFISISRKAKYVLDADIAKCFDKIDHSALIAKLQTFPNLRKKIKQWLKAGVMDAKELYSTEEGCPQGGIVSPLLANIALHGLEETIISTIRASQKADDSSPQVIKYADDFVVLHKDLAVIEQAKQIASDWLNGMGLELKPSKTKITHTFEEYNGSPGFDFLGFTVRQYPAGKNRSGKSAGRNTHTLGFKTIIRPSKKAIDRHNEAIKEVLNKAKTASQEKLINRLNPLICGWINYYSTVPSAKDFTRTEYLTFLKLWRWACRRHPGKPADWVYKKYWCRHKGLLVFGTKEGKTLAKHVKSGTRRHIKVQGKRTPYDGDWLYWSNRLGRYPGKPKRITNLIKKQKGKCVWCKHYFRPEDCLEIDHIQPRTLKGDENEKNKHLLHAHCHDEKTARDGSLTARGTYDKSQAIEEPYEATSFMYGSEDESIRRLIGLV